MKYTDSVREYKIDLLKPPEKRWSSVIRSEKRIANELFDEALGEFEAIPGFNSFVGKAMKRVFRHLYSASGGRYMEEMSAWADGLGRSFDDVLLLQCSYEFSQLPEYIKFISPLGCTAGVNYIEGLGMVHVRNLDWSINNMGKATRVFRFKEDEREFIVIGVPGLVGALSGMLPEEYSVTINYAPASSRPCFGFGPLFLLRDVLENCDSYEYAAAALSNTKISSNVFFTVCGAEENQACVIERIPADCSVRPYCGKPLCQANHFVSPHFSKRNKPFQIEDEDGYSIVKDSASRIKILSDALASKGACRKISTIARVLDSEYVCNNDTHQQMVFCPKNGEFFVRRSCELG